MSREAPFVLGLTGSIGMGKSTTAELFRAEGVPVWDADAAVRRLYGPGGAAVEPVSRLCPGAVVGGALNRDVLKHWIAADAGALARLEAVGHPLVSADRAGFLEQARQAGAPLVVVDIPLLFETGAEAGTDAVAVVSATADEQRARVLARPGMTEEHFARILARQMPDAEKRRRADHVIETHTLKSARAAVQALVRQLTAGRG